MTTQTPPDVLAHRSSVVALGLRIDSAIPGASIEDRLRAALAGNFHPRSL
jgi:hypothetical protein